MATYCYTIVTPTGEKQEGKIVAENRQAALTTLQSKGNLILELNTDESSKKEKIKKIRLSRSEKLSFIKNLSAMISAGITITEAISILQQQKPGRMMQSFLNDLSQLIKGGQSLGKSLEYFKDTFSPIFINMVKVGEQSGNLDQVLGYLEEQMEKDYEIIRKVKGAMVYPIIILTVTFGLAIFLIVFIIPKISRIFTAFKLELPLPTRILIELSDIFRFHSWKIVIFSIIFFWFLRWLKNRKSIKPLTHAIILKIPIFGKLSRTSNIARFTRILTSLLKSGVPLVESLEVISNTLNNVLYQKKIMEIRMRVEKGESLGKSLIIAEDLFPPLISRMIDVGEKTGTLERTTLHLAVMYEKDVDNITKNLSTILEPLLLLTMGVVVGGIALSIITPIYKIPQMIQR